MNIKEYLKFWNHLTFRKQIIVIVVGLTVIPLVLFGLHTINHAGRTRQAEDRIKRRLIGSISSEIEAYFMRISGKINFINELDAPYQYGEVRINRVLLNAYNSESDVIEIGYLRDDNLLVYFGNNSESQVRGRMDMLMKDFEEDENIQLSNAYTVNQRSYYSMLYPLQNEDFIYITFPTRYLNIRLSENQIEETGKFAIFQQNKGVFLAQNDIESRLRSINIRNIIRQNRGEDFFNIQEDNFQIMGNRVEGVIWPLWIVFSQDLNEVNSFVQSLRINTLFILLIFISISGAVSYYLSKNFSRPVANLMEAVKKNYGGQLDTKAKIDKRDKGELALLLKAFNEMVDKIKEAREELINKKKLAAVGEMANVIGHDIRNPLAAIKNGSYFLKVVSDSDNEKVSQTLGTIEREVDNISSIVENLLGYSRQRDPVLKPVDVNALMDEVISIIEPPENVEIIKKYDEDMEKFNLDRGEIKQAMVNLINNAVQACNKPKGIVKVITFLKKDNLHINVVDNGKGIPKEDLNNIFKAFYSTKEGGTGLGMSSVKNIIDRHLGTLNIRSKVGKGTKMLITIPPREATEK